MERSILLAIMASALLTALMRVVPVLLLSQFRLAPLIQKWLGFIPAAIMAAIITAELLEKPVLTSNGISVSLLAAVIAAVTGLITRGLFVTILAGMAAYSGLRYFFGL